MLPFDDEEYDGPMGIFEDYDYCDDDFDMDDDSDMVDDPRDDRSLDSIEADTDGDDMGPYGEPSDNDWMDRDTPLGDQYGGE